MPRRGKRLTIWLPEDHFIFTLPPGRRSEYVRWKLAGVDEDLIQAVRQAVREAVKEAITDQQGALKPELPASTKVDVERLRADILEIFG